MATADIDWRVLRGASVVFGIAVLLSVALVIAGQRFRDRMHAEFEAHQAQFRAVSQQYLAVDDEERIIVDYLPQFRRYFDAGIIGAERRLDWVAALRDAGAAIKLPDLAYDIESQAPYAADYPIQLGEFDLYSSRMHLDAGMLHEGDFSALLATLDAEANGLYTLSRCTFERAGAALDLTVARTNITASCEIAWLTLKLRGGREITL